jgi:hypothetical protein
VKQERRERGKTEPCPTRKRTPKWLALKEDIEQLVEAQPDATLQESTADGAEPPDALPGVAAAQADVQKKS